MEPKSNHPFGQPLVSVVEGVRDYQDSQVIASMIRDSLAALSLPEDFVQPGDRVVIKPNWVKEHDTRTPEDGESWVPIITHPVVIHEVVRWAAERLNGHGTIVLCDAPQSDSSFDAIRLQCGLDALLSNCTQEFPGVGFLLFDLRCEEWTARDGVTVAKRQLSSDPAGATDIDLGDDSEFKDFPGLGHLYGASYDFITTNRQHGDRHHEYRICRSPMAADVLINLPKLKTHKKVGLTAALKNLVGTTPRTNWLPRHTEGTPAEGGDQFANSSLPRKTEGFLMRRAKRLLRGRYRLSRFFVPLKKVGRIVFGDTSKVVRSGNWHGNDTAWRMILDLHKCFFYFNADSRRRETPLRHLAIVDGIIAGEGDGPMACDPKPCGVIIAGTNPVAVDCVCARLMGFDWRKTRLLRHAFEMDRLPITDFAPSQIMVHSNNSHWDGQFETMENCFEFRCHFGWKGHLETDERLRSPSPG